MPDHYTYPGTDVLVNRFGYTDPQLWKAAERRLVFLRLNQLIDAPIPGDFDLPHLQAIHRHLVQDLYTWGGQLRDTDTGPGGTGIAHCRPRFISSEADRIFTALADAGHLRGRDADAFSAGLAGTWGEMTALHPFRDGNTRSQVVFFTQLAAEAGWVIDWARIDIDVFAHARTVAITGDESGLDALIRPALVTTSDARRGSELDSLRRMVEARATRPRRAQTPTQLDRALHAAIEHRRSLGAENLSKPDPPDRPPPA